ncbi:unnamed protein product [Closterium sp. NIES-53]
MAGPEERGGRGAGGSGEAQAQGQPRDSAMAPMQPSLGPPRDEPRVFGLDKFNGDNFAEWSFKMEKFFYHYDLLEVMEGTEKRPENDPEKSPWVRKSAQGYLLLGQALGSSQIRHIKPFQREPEKGPKAWAALKGIHAPATAAVVVVMERQMAALRIEEDEAVEEGVQKFFDLWTRLEGADFNYSELQKKTKLLALLPESWSSLIINLNRDLPRLSLEDVKRAILQEDFRRRELASADGAGAASIGREYGRGRGRGRGGSRFGSNNFSGGRGSGGYGSDNKSYGRGRGRFDGECHYCHKSGHMWRDCFKRPHGWTPAQGQEGRGAGGGRGRGRGGRGGRGGGAASMKSAGNESESRDDRFPGQFFFVSTQASAGPEKDEGFEEPAALGKVTLHSLDFWVIDSGATYSMTPRADLLTELEPSPVKHVTSALGRRAEVKGMGKAMFKGADWKMVGLKNMLWVPNLAANLISVRRLQKAGMDTSSKVAKIYTARLGERILWDLHKDRSLWSPCLRRGKWQQASAPRVKRKLGEHEKSGAAAKKQHKDEENPKAAAEEYGENMWGTIASAAFSSPTSATGECDWLTLHRRMGHVALPILQQLVKYEMVAGIRVKGEPDEVLGCSPCMQAKFTRYPFSSSEATAKALLDEVVMDVVGPLKLGAAGAEYFLTIVDVYTCMTWVYVLSKKSDVAETVKTDWLPMVEWQQDRLVKAIRTVVGEFLSKEFSLWLKKNGTKHSFTMPYSPAMNGIAERANRIITETARGLLIEAGLPEDFWPDAVWSACVATNRALTHVGADKWVPYVEWIGRKPKVDMLRVFGCMCMALVPKHLRHNKLGAKAIWAVHLGMAQNSKGWLLWDPFTKKLLVSRDCKFMENLMYMDWKAENEAKIGMRFGEVKSSGLEHVELPLELSTGSTTTRQSFLLNRGEEAKDAEEEDEEVQQVSERAPTLPSRTTSAPRIRVTPQQRQGLHVPAAEEEGRGKRRIQAPNRLTYDALGKPAKSALAGAALIVGDDEESDYEESAFAFFSPVEMPGEPATLKEALESSDAKDWKKAMESELKSIEENGTWELVELPEGRKAITSKWLFKIKSDADGKIECYKSRLVAKGYQQKEKMDYTELFAPVVKPTTLRTLLAGAAIKGWVVKQMDVTTAFLNGVLEEENFMAQPEGFDDGSGKVLRLKKALYGLKQAHRQWYLKLRGVLEEIGFTPSTADHSLFMLGEGEQRSFMVVYVDDILIFSPSSDIVKEVMLKLQDKFKCKALGDVNFYLELHIERDAEKRCMRVHQRKYMEALAANFGLSEGHVATPFPSGFKCVKGPEEESVGEEERRRFHSLVGSLMYAAANTRSDVAFATGQLARVVQCPNEEQVAAGMRVAKYLGQTPTVGLQYSAAAQRRQKGADGVEPVRLFLTAFSDASYASEPEDMTSVGGFICCVGGGPTAWESKKQVDQALSSVESEYMTLFRAVREIVWQRCLLAELGEEQQGPTPLYCDSQGAIALAKNPVLHGLTKHMRSSPPERPDPVVSGDAGGAVAEGVGTGAVGASGAGSGGAGSMGVEATPLKDTAASRRRPCPTSPPGFPSVRSSLLVRLCGRILLSLGVCLWVVLEALGVSLGGSGFGGAGAGGTGTSAPTPHTQEQQQEELQSHCQEIVEAPQPQQERVEEEPQPQQGRVEEESRSQRQVQLQPQQEMVEEDPWPQQQVRLQLQQERVMEEPQPQQLGQILTRFHFPFFKVQLTPLGVHHGLTVSPSDEPFKSSGPFPELWYLKLRGVLEEIGVTPSSADHSLFMLGEGEQRSFMVVYVDDILIFSPSSDLVKEVMLKLQDKFKCKALGDVSFYLGLYIERDMQKRCMRVHQRKYLVALAANFKQSEGHVATPFPSRFKCVKGPEEESVGEEEKRRFHSLVGSLMYAAVNTRPDIAFATGQLARVVQCPNEEQVAAGMRVAKYLGQTLTVRLQYSAAAQRRQEGADGVEPGRLFLTAFSDASYASEPEDMTSVGGFIFCVGGGPTAWESKKQVDQALSSVESEYMALFRAVREIVWQRRLLAELGEEQQGPTLLYCDS